MFVSQKELNSLNERLITLTRKFSILEDKISAIEEEKKISIKKKKKILSYICFETAETFEKWQIDNSDIKIANILPFLASINFEFKEDSKGSSAGATTKASTFITYWK